MLPRSCVGEQRIKHSVDFRLNLILRHVNGEPICVRLFSTEKNTSKELAPPTIFLKSFLEDIEWLHFNLLVCNEKKISNGWEKNICFAMLLYHLR